MSTLFSNTNFPRGIRRPAAVGDHQPHSWLDRWLACSERMHQRAGLRDIAENPHLLADLGLTREEALEQAKTPFWR